MEAKSHSKSKKTIGDEPVSYTHLCEDAEIVVVTIGANVGTTRVAVDLAREKGKKVRCV